MEARRPRTVQDLVPHLYGTRIGTGRRTGIPALTPAQNEALSVFNDVADRVAVSMEFKPGDIEYFNNHVVLHTRTQFSDENGLGRHLMRVWLSMSNFRKLSPEHPISLKTRMQHNEHRQAAEKG